MLQIATLYLLGIVGGAGGAAGTETFDASNSSVGIGCSIPLSFTAYLILSTRPLRAENTRFFAWSAPESFDISTVIYKEMSHSSALDISSNTDQIRWTSDK